MRRYVTHVEVMGAGRYRVTVKSKRWWQRRWRSTTYNSVIASVTRWEESLQPGVLVPTELSWWLTEIVITFVADIREAKHAAR